MNKFKVSLTRTYFIDIESENEKSAKEFVEYFIGDLSDNSNVQDREKYKFKISDIELVYNEATEIISI